MGDYSQSEIQQDFMDRHGLELEKAVTLNNSAVVLIFAGHCDMRDIKKANIILNQRVKIEPYRVKLTAVTQCKNCLEFGHIASYCGRTTREAWVLDHKDDGNPSADEETKRCAQCGEAGHIATQARCLKFQEEINKQRARRVAFKEARAHQKEANIKSDRHFQPAPQPPPMGNRSYAAATATTTQTPGSVALHPQPLMTQWPRPAASRPEIYPPAPCSTAAQSHPIYGFVTTMVQDITHILTKFTQMILEYQLPEPAPSLIRTRNGRR